MRSTGQECISDLNFLDMICYSLFLKDVKNSYWVRFSPANCCFGRGSLFDCMQ